MSCWSVGLSQCAFSEHRANLIINPINQSFFYPPLKDIKAKYVNQYARNYDDKISNSTERIKFMGTIFIWLSSFVLLHFFTIREIASKWICQDDPKNQPLSKDCKMKSHIPNYKSIDEVWYHHIFQPCHPADRFSLMLSSWWHSNSSAQILRLAEVTSKVHGLLMQWSN